MVYPISKIIRWCFVLSLFALIVSILIWPQNLYEGVSKGLIICSNVIIPSLFPFCVLSLIVFNIITLKDFYLPILKVDSNIILIIIMSMIGGYPTGAKLIANAYKTKGLDKKSANILLLFCVNAGPSFVITAIGFSAFNSIKIGILLFSSHILSSIVLFGFFRKKLTKIKINSATPSKLSEAFVISVSEASKTIIVICAYVILFSGISSIINGFNFPSIYKKTLIYLLEVSASILDCKNLYLTAFLLGFSGLSVILQIFSISAVFLESPLKILVSRLVHGVLSVINLFLLLKIFPVDLETISTPANYIYQFNSTNLLFSILLIGFSFLLMGSVLYRQYCGKLSKDMF